MVHTNKVLTVSYGTFSCTLEGFDDSFSTMKAIAEYFRDLAADDRYFGAEPPQPDVDMLARIAQREISRRVEAHSDGAGIVLRASEAAAAIAPTGATADTVSTTQADPETDPATATGPRVGSPLSAMATPPESALEAAREPTTVSVAQAAPAQAPAQDPEPAPQSVPSAAASAEIMPAADSIAAKLQRIRAVVSRSEAEVEDADYSEDEHADAFLASAARDLNATMTVENGFAEDFEDETAEGDDLALALAGFERDAAGAEPSTEGTDAQDADQEADTAGNETGGEGEAAQDPVDMASADDPAVTDQASADAPEIAPVAADAVAAETAAAQLEATEPETADSGTGENEHDGAAEVGENTIFAGIEQADAAPGAPDSAQADLSGAAAGVADLDMQNILRPDDDSDDDDSDDVDDETTTKRPRRARVVKVRRSDLEAAIAQGALEEIETDRDTDKSPDTDTGTNSSLSAEEEADLMRELAEVEAELGDTAPPVSGESEDDVSRLMNEADQKMDEPETVSRRDAYTQLRAAVAATRAEQSVTGEPLLLSHDEDYRNDLANVVRPRRPSAAGTGGQRRPSEDRPAPLKLVAEQRVDDAAGEARRGPVRPRRVSPADMAEAIGADPKGTTGGFIAFANEAGATGLSELLEAAAAYMSFVEGREHFSRPQLMTKVRQIEQDDFNREDGLRSFGQLLREGKIRKTRGGRFTASEEIGFKPAHRATG